MKRPPDPPHGLAGFRIDHLGIVVPDLDAAVRFYRDVLGLAPGATVAPDGQGIAVAFVPFANMRVELIAPTVAVSPLPHLLEDQTVNHFLARNPTGGFHHVCYEVPDLASVVARLARHGVRILGDGKPILGASGKPIVFLDPKMADGTLIELKQG